MPLSLRMCCTHLQTKSLCAKAAAPSALYMQCRHHLTAHLRVGPAAQAHHRPLQQAGLHAAGQQRQLKAAAAAAAAAAAPGASPARTGQCSCPARAFAQGRRASASRPAEAALQQHGFVCSPTQRLYSNTTHGVLSPHAWRKELCHPVTSRQIVRQASPARYTV